MRRLLKLVHSGLPLPFGSIRNKRSMVALDIPNSRHKDFQEAIDSGEFLMLIDVPKNRVIDIEKLVMLHHPNAELEKVEPRVLNTPPGY